MVLPGFYWWVESKYASVKLTKEVEERLEAYARPRGLTLSAAIDRLLVEEGLRLLLERQLEELEEIRKLLEEQNRELRAIRLVLERGEEDRVEEVSSKEKSVSREDLADMPSFIAGNPWLEVLSRRGGG